VWDSREQPPHADVLRAELPQVRLFGGDLGDTLPEGVKLVLKSPGLAPHDPRIAPLLAPRARRRHRGDGRAGPVHARAGRPEGADRGGGEGGRGGWLPKAAGRTSRGRRSDEARPAAALADPDAGAPMPRPRTPSRRRHAEAPPVIAPPPPPDPGYAPQVIAITGTNGKTTTTAMTGLLVERAGRRVAVAGNIMPTMLDRLMAMLDGPREDWVQVWVLELSSFQLADAGPSSPRRRGAQRHAGPPGLARRHGRLRRGQGAHLRPAGGDGGQPRRCAGRGHGAGAGGHQGRPRQARGHAAQGHALRPDAPERPGDFGLVVENGMAWLVRAMPVDETLKKRKDEVEEIHLQRLMPADALRIRGRHNAANALAALALATAIGCPLAPMLHGLREYTGEPHRVEWIGTVGGIEAFDDTKGTNVGATVAALDGLGADKAPGKLVVILGGDGKGQDFAPLLRRCAATRAPWR
jgi:UDP-N-acetylmuramoylalanine--D-glutamate ligase